MAELPGALMLLLVGLMLPMIIYGTFFYRVYMFNMLVKTACQVGAAQTDVATATTAIKNYMDKNVFVGIKKPTQTVTTVTRATTYNVPTSGSKTYDVYYLQLQADTEIYPLIGLPKFFGTVIPGLSGNLPLTMTTQVYFENQQALIK